MFSERKKITYKPEYLVPVIATGSLITSCMILSSKKFFWMDELVSYYLVTDPSFLHMLNALANQADASPPLWFCLTWIWSGVFGTSEVTLRLFSSICIGGAFLITWTVLYHRFNFWSSSISCTICFFLSHLILRQNCEARFYGLFFFWSALTLLIFNKVTPKQKISGLDYILNFLSHAALVLTHVYGFLYSGSVLLAFIISDYYLKILRPKLYLSIMAGWASFIIWAVPFYRQMDLGDPHSWITVPNFLSLFLSLIGVYNNFSVPLLILAILLFLLIRRNRLTRLKSNEVSNRLNTHNELTLLFFGLSLSFIVPILAWTISKLTVSIFFYRYFIPGIIGWSIIFSWIFHRYLPTVFSNSKSANWKEFFNEGRKKTALVFTLLFFLIYPILFALNAPAPEKPGSDMLQFDEELPIITESPHDYLPRFHYSSNEQNYYLVLDWEAAIDTQSVLAATAEYKLMKAIKKFYPFHNIIESDELLEKFDNFLVLDRKGRRWSEMRIENNPDYQCFQIKNGFTSASGWSDPMDMIMIVRRIRRFSPVEQN